MAYSKAEGQEQKDMQSRNTSLKDLSPQERGKRIAQMFVETLKRGRREQAKEIAEQNRTPQETSS